MKSDYKGFIKHKFETLEDMAVFYGNIDKNVLDLNINEYAILYSPDDVMIDKVKWNGEKNVVVSYKSINNDWFKTVRPLNVEQELLFDLLQDKTTTVKLVTGKQGSGKTFLACCHALQNLKQNRFDRIVYTRNNVSLKNVPEIGFLPGDQLEKTIAYAMPLADCLGGKDGLTALMIQGKIVIEPLGFMRGRSFKNTLIFVSEAENLTADIIKLLIGRVGEGSIIVFDGDISQCDKQIFEKDNGILALINKLSNQKLFGYVELQKTERSETAELSELFD